VPLPPNKPRVVAFVRDRTDEARLIGALRDTGELVTCRHPAEVIETVAVGGAAAAIVTAYRSLWNDAIALTHALRTRFPHVPILVYYDPDVISPRELLEFFDVGVTDVIQRDVDDIRRVMVTILAAAGQKAATRRLINYLRPHLPPKAVPILDYVMDNADAPLSIDQAASAIGIARRTLYRRLEKLGYPPPETLIGWCRLLLAAQLLEDEGRSFDDVALTLSFPSGMALRSMLKRYVGVTGRRAREGSGPLALVLSQLTQRLTTPAGGTLLADPDPDDSLIDPTTLDDDDD
jgi:AraC-like DNA-binding protein